MSSFADPFLSSRSSAHVFDTCHKQILLRQVVTSNLCSQAHVAHADVADARPRDRAPRYSTKSLEKHCSPSRSRECNRRMRKSVVFGVSGKSRRRPSNIPRARVTGRSGGRHEWSSRGSTQSRRFVALDGARVERRLVCRLRTGLVTASARSAGSACSQARASRAASASAGVEGDEPAAAGAAARSNAAAD